MRTMQQKILTALDEQAEAHNYDLVQTRNYANTGTLYWQREWETILQVKYDFQNTYFGLKAQVGQLPAGSGYVEYAKADEVAGLFAAIAEILKGVK